MSYRRATGLLLAGFLIALVGSGVAAGEGPEVFGLKTSGDVVLGGRVFIERPSPQDRAKWEEYRDLPYSAFLEYLRLRGDSEDDFYTVEIFGKNGGQTDQEYKLRAYGVGTFDFLFEWNQIPHLFCTNCRTLLTNTDPKTFILPTPRPPLTDWNSAPLIDEIGFNTDVATVSASYSPDPDWDIGLDLSLRYKNGDRPVGLAFGSPGNDAVEVPVPMNSYTYGAHLNAGYAGDGYQLQFGYDLSIYNNNINFFRADNPVFGDPGEPPEGQGSRFPSNWATSLSLAGGVNLPMNTRVTGSLSYGWRWQSQEFLPFTINSALQPGIADAQAALPNDLDGEVKILRFNLNATSRPLDKLTTTANFRIYSYNDDSPEIPFTAYVEDDRVIQDVGADGPIRGQLARRYPYTKYNAGVDARYELLDSLAIKAGFYYERWARSGYLLTLPPSLVETGGDSVLNIPREVAKTNEYTPKVMVDYTPLDWLQVRASYAYSWRSGTDYLQASEEQLALLRKYTMSDRNRNRVDLLADVWAMDNLTFTANFGWVKDSYSSTTYGLQEVKTWSAGGDVSWRPLEWLRVFAGYLHEEVTSDSRQKFRRISGADDELNNPTFDWVTDNKDTYDTVRLGLDATIIPKKLEGGATWNFSVGQTDMNAFNPLTPTCATCTFADSALAEDFPGLESRLSILNVFLRYWLTENWAATVRYSFENFSESDFRADGLQPFNASTGDTIYLGADARPYTAHYLTLSLGYSF